MRIKLIIISFILILPTLIFVGEYKLNTDKSFKRKEFIKYFHEKSNLIKPLRKIGFEYQKFMGATKIGSICLSKTQSLYYCPTTDGDPLKDLFSEVNVGDRVRDPLVNKLRGYSNFYYFDIPSRLRVFTEDIRMPFKIEKNDLLSRKVAELYTSVFGSHYKSIAANTKVLERYKDEYIYYYRDSHWTPYGAYKLIESMNFPFFRELKFKKRVEYIGETADMANTFFGTKYESIDYMLEAIPLEKKANVKILLLGDSYRFSLSDTLSAMVEEVRAESSVSPDFSKINLETYDYIFVVRVERYMRNIFSN